VKLLSGKAKLLAFRFRFMLMSRCRAIGCTQFEQACEIFSQPLTFIHPAPFVEMRKNLSCSANGFLKKMAAFLPPADSCLQRFF
jgi:hypothetical protein